MRCAASPCKGDIYVSVAGIDVVRGEDGQFVVLEDNLRMPSGVSYMLANREVTKRVLPRLFERHHVRPIAHYGQVLLATLRALGRRRHPRRPSSSSRREWGIRPTSSTPFWRARWASHTRRGVCQDFSHIMLVLVRRLGVPCRYVSGYLFHQSDVAVRSTDGATHAWIEAPLPDCGWIGLDPTNNRLAGERHIRVAIGRDYADVPPTRGVFKGLSAVKSELAAAVAIGPAQVALSRETSRRSCRGCRRKPWARQPRRGGQQQ